MDVKSYLLDPGITRAFKRRNGNPEYRYSKSNRRVIDNNIIQRINALRIPPAWTQVWISSNKNSHIQATGLDNTKKKTIFNERFLDK